MKKEQPTPEAPAALSSTPCIFSEALHRHETGQLVEADRLYRQVLATDPHHAGSLHRLGVIALQVGRYDAATELIGEAIKWNADEPSYYNDLGSAWRGRGRLAEALNSFDRALVLRPQYAEAHYNRGNALQEQGALDQALLSYDRALAINPDFAEACNNRGNTLKSRGLLDEALASYNRAVALKPDYAEAYNNRGTVLKDLGQPADALASYNQALSLDRNNSNIWRGLLNALLYHPDIGFPEKLLIQREFASRMEARAVEAPPAVAHDRQRERRLRIGWLSSDFRDHPVGRCLAPFFEERDRHRFETICYAEVKAPDRQTDWFRDRADQWHSTLGLSDSAVAQLIRSDRIDVMLYVAGRFDRNRPQVAAWRPAPVQVSIFDGATSGLEAMDYFIADRHMAPARTAEPFSERVLRLPFFYVNPPLLNAPPPSPPPSQTAGNVTFGCLNNPAKLNDSVLRLWATLLDRVPRSRLVLKYQNFYRSARLRARIEGVMAQFGIDRSRIDMGGEREPAAAHLAQYAHIDIALDPFPFNGSSTTFEALWMGVPVVTLLGSSVMARWTASMLHALDLDDLIATSPDDYIEIVLRLAGDGRRLATLRSQLRGLLAGSTLCDGRGATRYLERALRAVWCRHC